MTLLGQENRPVKIEWDKPRGRLRHVEVKPDGAVYVVEKRPGWTAVTLGRISHDVWLPWRYHFVKVRTNGIVSGKNGLALFFAEKQAKSIDDPVLRMPFFPNVYGNSGIACIGDYSLYVERSPLRGVLKTIRKLYSKKGTLWLIPSIPNELLRNASHQHPPPQDFQDTMSFCYWSTLEEVEAAKIAWKSAVFPTIREAADRLNYDAVIRQWTDEIVDRNLREGS